MQKSLWFVRTCVGDLAGWQTAQDAQFRGCRFHSHGIVAVIFCSAKSDQWPLNTETTPIWQVSKLEWSQCSTATYATSALGNRVCAEENCWTISRCWWWRHGHEAVNAVRNSRALDESLQVKGETCWCQVVKIYSNLVHPRQIGNCFWMFLTSSLWALWAVFLRLDDTMSNILQVD